MCVDGVTAFAEIRQAYRRRNQLTLALIAIIAASFPLKRFPQHRVHNRTSIFVSITQSSGGGRRSKLGRVFGGTRVELSGETATIKRQQRAIEHAFSRASVVPKAPSV